MLRAATGEAAKLLAECGYEDLSDADAAGVDAALTRRRAAVFEELAGMAPQPEVVDIFRLKYDYHNLKTLVKARRCAGFGRQAVVRLRARSGR
ncbi:MAG: V-type ATPase subunit [Lachnospiraceae bacterium]